MIVMLHSAMYLPTCVDALNTNKVGYFELQTHFFFLPLVLCNVN